MEVRETKTQSLRLPDGFEEKYGYQGRIEDIREREFERIKGTTYLDHAGATLYAQSQLDKYFCDLNNNLYGNPHSKNPSSQVTSDIIDHIRARILQHFNTNSDQYSVIFTSGATASLKLVAESFDWTSGRCDCNHSSRPKCKHHLECKSSSKCHTCVNASCSENEENDYMIKCDQHSLCDNLKYFPDALQNINCSETCKNSCTACNNSKCMHDAGCDDLKCCMQSGALTYSEQKCLKPADNCDDFNCMTRGKLHQSSIFCYLEDNHTSVVGMREIAAENGAQTICVTDEDMQYQENVDASNDFVHCRKSWKQIHHSCRGITQSNHRGNACECNASQIANGECSNATCIEKVSSNLTSEEPVKCKCKSDQLSHLFAFPAMSNFSGNKYPLEWVSKIKEGRMHPCRTASKSPGKWFVFLDAASYVTSSPLDLSKTPADFVCISFYKMFGFPTGIGALLVDNRCVDVLKKKYFGGGTVSASITNTRFHVFRPELNERFEDGTVSFLDIVALQHGFDTLTQLTGNTAAIKDHTFCLAQYTYQRLISLKHGSGHPVCHIYCDNGFSDVTKQGPIISFNLFRANGEYVGYSEVNKMANLYDIHLRTGCFCNTGACQRKLGLTNEQLKLNYESGHVCGDEMDLVNGLPTGAVRISFGYMSNFADAQTFLQMIEECFVDNSTNLVKIPPASPPVNITEDYSERSCDCDSELGDKQEQEMILKRIVLYPIKSCAPYQVSEWEIGPRGLMFDREWMIVNKSGICLSQKREARLCLIKPSFDFQNNVLIVKAQGMSTLKLPLYPDKTLGKMTEAELCSAKVCGDRVQSYDCGREAAEWISTFLGQPCKLLRQNTEVERKCRLPVQPTANPSSLSLANESPFLLVSCSTARNLMEEINHSNGGTYMAIDDDELGEFIDRFRANIIVTGNKPYEEDHWKGVTIGRLSFQNIGKCSRCQMVCLNQRTGKRSQEPLKTLAKCRGSKIPFGIYLFLSSTPSLEQDGIFSLRCGSQVSPT